MDDTATPPTLPQDAPQRPRPRLATFNPDDALPDNAWADAARQLRHYRLTPLEIAEAIEAVHAVSNAITDPHARITLADVLTHSATVGAAVALLREQAVIYERMGVRVAASAADDAVATLSAGAKALSEAALTRIGESARLRYVEYTALLEAERANGETILRVLRRIYDARMAHGDPPEPETPTSDRKQIDLNSPTLPPS